MFQPVYWLLGLEKFQIPTGLVARYLLILLFQVHSPLKRNKSPPHHLICLVNSLFRIQIAKEFTSEIEHILSTVFTVVHRSWEQQKFSVKMLIAFVCFELRRPCEPYNHLRDTDLCLGTQTAEILQKYHPAPSIYSKKDKTSRAVGLQGQRSNFPISNVKICSRKPMPIDSNGIGCTHAKDGKSIFWSIASQWLYGDHQTDFTLRL